MGTYHNSGDACLNKPFQRAKRAEELRKLTRIW